MLLIAFALFADISNPSVVETWAGPIFTSTASVAATVFAYLTARDRLRYDATGAIREARLQALETEHNECREERVKDRMRMARMAANLNAHMIGKPIPFPDEMGLLVEESGADIPNKK